MTPKILAKKHTIRNYLVSGDRYFARTCLAIVQVDHKVGDKVIVAKRLNLPKNQKQNENCFELFEVTLVPCEVSGVENYPKT